MAERSSSSKNSTNDSQTMWQPIVRETAMEETFGLTIMKNETTKAFTGRSKLVFTRS